MTATKIWRRSSRRFVPAKQRISKCAPSSYASKNEHGPMRSSSCLPIRSSNIWPPAGAPSTSPWKKDSKPLRRSVSSKYHQKMPPAITASPHLVPPLPTYCIAQTSSSPRSSPSLGLVCPRRKNSNQNDLFCEFSYLAGFWLFGLGGEDGVQLVSHGSPGGQPLAYLCNPGFPLPLHRQRPAPQNLLLRQPLHKAVLARHGHSGLGLRLRGRPLA